MHVKPHDVFQRHDDDIYCEIPVPYPLSVLGGEVEVPTLMGYAKLKIPAGTPSGKTFRLKNKGIKDPTGRGCGDQHVKVTVDVPTHLSSKQKKVLKEFNEILGDSNPATESLKKKLKQFYERKETLEKKTAS